MLKCRLAVALLACTVLVVSPVRASPFTSHFDDLGGELAARRDGDLSGELDKASKQQLKAVLKCLKLLDKDADDLGDDLKTLGKLGGLLEKAFPDEFQDAEAPLTFGALVSDAAVALDQDVGAALASLLGGLDALSGKAAAKVQALGDKALAALDVVTTPLPAKPFAKSRAKAWKFIKKGNKVAAKDQGGGGGGVSSISMELEGTPLTGDASTKIEVHKSGNVLQVSSAFPDGDTTYYLYIYIEGVTGTGTFPLVGGSTTAFVNCVPNVGDGTIYTASAGSLEVTSYDKKKRIVGSFSFTATHQSAGSLAIEAGAFDITNIELY